MEYVTNMEIHTTISDYILSLAMVFGFFTFGFGCVYVFLRIIFSKVRPILFRFLPIILWSFVPFIFLLMGGSHSLTSSIPGLFIGMASGYILERFTIAISNLKTSPHSGGRDPTRFIGRFRSKSTKSSSSSSRSSSGSNRSDFGGGGFSGGGGSGKW